MLHSYWLWAFFWRVILLGSPFASAVLFQILWVNKGREGHVRNRHWRHFRCVVIGTGVLFGCSIVLLLLKSLLPYELEEWMACRTGDLLWRVHLDYGLTISWPLRGLFGESSLAASAVITALFCGHYAFAMAYLFVRRKLFPRKRIDWWRSLVEGLAAALFLFSILLASRHLYLYMTYRAFKASRSTRVCYSGRRSSLKEDDIEIRQEGMGDLPPAGRRYADCQFDRDFGEETRVVEINSAEMGALLDKMWEMGVFHWPKYGMDPWIYSRMFWGIDGALELVDDDRRVVRIFVDTWWEVRAIEPLIWQVHDSHFDEQAWVLSRIEYWVGKLDALDDSELQRATRVLCGYTDQGRVYHDIDKDRSQRRERTIGFWRGLWRNSASELSWNSEKRRYELGFELEE